MDFDSPESLANYLKKLMNDDELYLTYFRWRRKYFVDLAPKDSWCQLCRMLRDSETKTCSRIVVTCSCSVAVFTCENSEHSRPVKTLNRVRFGVNVNLKALRPLAFDITVPVV
jgi:hypothetical protein